MLEIVNANGEVVNTYFSKEAKIAEFSTITFWSFEPFVLDLAEGEKLRVLFSQDGVTADRNATFRAETVKQNGSDTSTNGSNAVGSNGSGYGWIVRTLFKCTLTTTIHQKLNDHTTNQDLHLTAEQKQSLLQLLQFKNELLALLQP